MRTKLETKLNTKDTYIASFKRRSRMRADKQVVTVLLIDIKDKRGRDITDHIWLCLDREEQLRNIKFKKNKFYKFTAEVGTYYKVIGEDENNRYWDKDFCLKNLNNVKEVNKLYRHYISIKNKFYKIIGG